MKRAVVVAVIAVVLLAVGVNAAAVPALTIHVYKDDKPVANAVVELWSNSSMIARGTTDSNGTIVFSNVSTGDYVIYVYVNGSVYRFDKTIDENTTELNLSLSAIEAVKASLAGVNNYVFLGGVLVAFIVGILIAYGLSGRRIPRR